MYKNFGSHEPIITEEEFNIVKQRMEKKRKEMTNITSGQRIKKGIKPPMDVWSELLICECGHKFNRKVWHRNGDEAQYGYQCYSSIRTGTIKTRLGKGLPIDGVCRSPMVAGWKLQMMVKKIFEEYLTNTVEVLSTALDLLDRHIDDKDEDVDNSKIIEQKQNEFDKLNNRLNNLIEMRADGEITKEVFMSKKKEIESRMCKLQEDIDDLSPESVDIEEDESHEEKIRILKYYLEKSIKPNDDADIPEDVVRAFVRKIVVHEDSFDWYLRFDPDNPPKTLVAQGKRGKGEVSSLCSPQHRQQLKRQSNRKSDIFHRIRLK